MSRAGRQRMSWFSVAAGLLLTAAALVLIALRENLTFFYTPSQVQVQGMQAGVPFRMGGRVVPGSLHKQAGTLAVHFVVTDENHRIPVVYEGLLPDLFGEDKGVVASGRLDGNGVFQAHQILAKHDETYQPPITKAGTSSGPAWVARNP